MSDDAIEDIPMAECGACESIIPLDSSSCSNCGAVFGEVSDTALGECGACGTLQSVNAEQCVSCGVSFVGSEDEAPSPTQTDEVETVDDNGATDIESTDESVPEETETAPEKESELEEAEAVPIGLETVDEVVVSTPEETDVESLLDDMSEEETDEIQEESNELEEETEDVADIEDDTATTIISATTIVEEVEEEEPSSADDVDDSEDNLEQESEDDVGQDSEADDTEEEGLDDEDESDDEQESDIDEEESDEEEQVSDEVIPAHGITDQEVISAFENLALAIASAGMTAAEAFDEIDRNDDGLIDGPELQKGIERIGGENLKPSSVKSIMNYLDSDDDNRIDPQELLGALDGLGFGIKAGNLPKKKKVKEFPTPAQKIIMGKKANDIYYPVLYFLFATFIGLWVVNGMGLIVDGTGGTIVYEGHQAEWGMSKEGNWDLCQADIDAIPEPCFGTVRVGETYPCDPLIDPNKCANSLTIFSGENGVSSMPKGFYGDGIFMIILGVIGIIGTAYLHLVYAKVLRERAEALKGPKTDDEETTKSEEEEEEDDDLSGDDSDDGIEDALEAPKDLVIEDEKESVESDESDEQVEDDDDSEEEEEDIDIGSWVGLDIDGEEFFGEIVEFDDEEGTVTIETEDGEEITGYQDEMFLDEE